MSRYERLHAWRECDKLALAAYEVTRKFPDDERYGLTSQLRRAAFSAAVNNRRGICATQHQGIPSFPRHLSLVVERSRIRAAVRSRGRTARRRGLVHPERPSKPRPVPHVAAVPSPRSPTTSRTSQTSPNLPNAVDCPSCPTSCPASAASPSLRSTSV